MWTLWTGGADGLALLPPLLAAPDPATVVLLAREQRGAGHAGKARRAMTRNLREIADEMGALTDGDPESSHARGDDLLIEAIERLAAYATETVDEGEDERLVTYWRSLRKWYA